ncbi:MAG: DoxX family protein [Gammaproteobacteria bacterium]|nr:DoxX family protein [Gammaproteobacteria bacterium]
MNTQTFAAPVTPSAISPLDRLAPLAFPLVRITTGLLLIPHGAQKLFGWFGGHGLVATGQYFESTLGMSPGLVFATLAGLIEFAGGLALVLGLLTRPVALALAVFMGVALSVHVPNGFFWTAGGIEYPLMWGLVALAIFLRGGDRFSLDRRLGLRI